MHARELAHDCITLQLRVERALVIRPVASAIAETLQRIADAKVSRRQVVHPEFLRMPATLQHDIQRLDRGREGFVESRLRCGLQRGRRLRLREYGVLSR